MKLWKYILPLMAVVVFASCSSKDEAEVIPRNKLADIYAEMFMTDQWITDTPGMRVIADTSLVYEPILAKYGYDKLDYIHSVDFYMNDPERFARILRSCMDKLDKRIETLQKLQKQLELAEEAAKAFEKFLEDYSFDEYFPYLGDEPYVHYYDSLTVEMDSLKVYRLVDIETADTLYDRLQMVVPSDSLNVCDTVMVRDTVTAVDTISKVDTLSVPKVKKPMRPERTRPTRPEGNPQSPQKRVPGPVTKGKVGENTDLNTNKELWQLSE